MQYTLKSAVSFTGVGLHSGRPVRMTVRPAAADFGIWFRRTDLVGGIGGQDPMLRAIWSSVTPSKLCTLLENEDGVTVSTIEHLMAAMAGIGLNNALIEIDGPEVPIMDGSSAPFVTAFMARGLLAQLAPLRTIRVLKPVEVRDGDAVARLEPAEKMEIDFRIEFAEQAIGTQERHLTLTRGSFIRDLADSRTFCRQSDVDAMQANGLALGGTLENAVVFDGDRVVSPGGLRHADEPVRHKMLDAVGDLFLAGGPILGRYTGIRAGHAMTNRLLRALFADPSNYVIEGLGLSEVASQPSVGVHHRTQHHGPRVAA